MYFWQNIINKILQTYVNMLKYMTRKGGIFVDSDYSNKLKSLRKSKRMTQEQLAQQIGVTKAMVSAYETGTKCPSIEVLLHLSQFFNVTIDYLLRANAPKCVDVSDLSDESIALIITMVNKLRRLHQNEQLTEY